MMVFARPLVGIVERGGCNAHRASYISPVTYTRYGRAYINDTAATDKSLYATRRKFAGPRSGGASLVTTPDDVTTEIKLTNKTAAELGALAIESSS